MIKPCPGGKGNNVVACPGRGGGGGGGGGGGVSSNISLPMQGCFYTCILSRGVGGIHLQLLSSVRGVRLSSGITLYREQ